MEKLDNKDLERFGWDKISPGIYQKIKKKKRRLLFLKVLKLGIIPVLLLIGFWLVPSFDQITESNLNNSTSTVQDVIKKKESNIPVSINNSEENSSIPIEKNKIKEHEQQSTIAVNEVPSIHSKSQSIASNTSISKATSQPKNISEKKANLIKLATSRTPTIAERTNRDFSKSNVSATSSIRRSNKSELLSNLKIQKSQTVIYQSQDETKTGVQNNIKQKEPVTNTNQEAFIPYAPLPSMNYFVIVDTDVPSLSLSPIIDIPKNDTQIPMALELSANINTLTKHPHASKTGIGMRLGYNVHIKNSQYLGFEFTVQRYKYRFTYPPEISIPGNENASNNTHTIYSLPIYYGYQFFQKRIGFSLETGIDLAFVAFSTGEISAINNATSIVTIADENYFRRNIGASWIIRGKVDFPLGRNFSLISRLGTQITFKNWYINDAQDINPMLFHFDLGVRKMF